MTTVRRIGSRVPAVLLAGNDSAQRHHARIGAFWYIGRLMKPCNLLDMTGWAEAELASIREAPIRRIITEAVDNLESLVRWPRSAELFWDGCRKIAKHEFPEVLRKAIDAAGLSFRNWSNDPAIYAYRLADGERPNRVVKHQWDVHHLYDGQFPYPGKLTTLVAVKSGRHFTQTAGLVAIHPVAHVIAGEYGLFAWRLRAESFLRFGYDPDGAFSVAQDEFGFAGKSCSRIWFSSPASKALGGEREL